jgi:hypothetical protein
MVDDVIVDRRAEMATDAITDHRDEMATDAITDHRDEMAIVVMVEDAMTETTAEREAVDPDDAGHELRSDHYG